ncbi:glycoside hydrolase family 2 protein, partial [Parabacteroides distasonis]
MTNEVEEVYTDIDYVDIERHLPFKEPELTVGIEGDILTFSAGRFARCVEILGDCDGDKFGWLFEDNYFDLMPGMTKRVKILGRHKYGIITVKAHYSSKEIVV